MHRDEPLKKAKTLKKKMDFTDDDLIFLEERDILELSHKTIDK